MKGCILTSGGKLCQVLVDERVEKDLRGILRHVIDKFVRILDELETDPIKKRHGVDIKKLKGNHALRYFQLLILSSKILQCNVIILHC